MSDYNEGKFQGRVNSGGFIDWYNPEIIDLSKRYWLLGWEGYYPNGGFSDVCFSSDDYLEAENKLNEVKETYRGEVQCELWDMQERKLLKGYEFIYDDVREIKEAGE